MEEKTTGIVLSKTEYGENDRILNIFTIDKGVISAKIKGVKKAGAKLKFASEPFCFAEYVFSVSPDGKKRTVISSTLIDSFYSLREDINKYFAGATALEFIKRFSLEEMVSPKAFTLLINFLKELTYGTEDVYNNLVKFLLSGLSLIGYGLNVTKGCKKCNGEILGRPFFDFSTGSFFCGDCANEWSKEINYQTFLAFNKVVNGERLSIEEGKFCLRLINFYLINKTSVELSSIKQLILE